MIDKFAGAIKDLRSTLGATQIEFAKRLRVGVPSLAHYETAGRRPEAATTALLCRAAHDAGRIDLAEIFAAALPGVEDGLLVPCWRLPNEPRPTPPDDEPPTRLLDRFEKPQQVVAVVDPKEPKVTAVQVHVEKAKGHQGER